MRILFITILTCLVSTVRSQEYKIKYDLVNDKSVFYRITDKKDTVKLDVKEIKKASKINLQIDNYNPYYWNAKITSYKKPVDEQVGFASLFSPFNMIGKSITGLIPALLPGINLPEAGVRGVNGTTEELKLIRLAGQFKTNYEQLDLLLEKYQSYKDLGTQLELLKFDNRRSENEIKSAATEITQKIIDPKELEFGNVLHSGRELDADYEKYTAAIESLHAELVKALPNVDKDKIIIENQSASDIASVVNTGYSKAEEMKNRGIHFTDELLSISKLYKEILNAEFKYNYIVNSSPDISEIKLELFCRDGQLSKDTLVKYFTVGNTNYIKIRNSLGIGFTHFAENNRSYYANADSSIGASKGNMFTPILSTFIHFYASRQKAIKWGAALGVGIPLEGEKKDINFMLGLSLIVGRNEPLIFTAGVAGTKVNKLKNNWNVGDKVLPEYFSNLTNPVYDIGMFLSVGFNLGTLNLSKKNND